MPYETRPDGEYTVVYDVSTGEEEARYRGDEAATRATAKIRSLNRLDRIEAKLNTPEPPPAPAPTPTPAVPPPPPRNDPPPPPPSDDPPPRRKTLWHGDREWGS
jgi:hypothetical protein